MDSTICRVTWKQRSRSTQHLSGILLREEEGLHLLVVPHRPEAEGAVEVEEAESLVEREDLAGVPGPLRGVVAVGLFRAVE